MTGVQAVGGASGSTGALGEKTRRSFTHSPVAQIKKSDNAKYSRTWENRNPHVLLEERLESTLESDVQYLVELEIHRPPVYVLHTRETRARACRETLRRILAVPPFVRKPNYKHLNVHQLENG